MPDRPFAARARKPRIALALRGRTACGAASRVLGWWGHSLICCSLRGGSAGPPTPAMATAERGTPRSVQSADWESKCAPTQVKMGTGTAFPILANRLLSGMHTAVNVHVALKAKMPKKNVPGREDWSADPARFVRQYGAHPERLRNLHFSFVVLLRALRRRTAWLCPPTRR